MQQGPSQTEETQLVTKTEGLSYDESEGEKGLVKRIREKAKSKRAECV